MTTAGPDIGSLYREHGPMVYRRILHFYGEAEAEEVLHEVFLQAMERLSTFRADASPSTWLYRIATNTCINRLRDHGRRRELLHIHRDDLWYATRQGASQEERAFLEQLWRALPEELVQIGVYHYIDGMTHGEIARVMGVSRRTIGNRLQELNEQARANAA